MDHHEHEQRRRPRPVAAPGGLELRHLQAFAATAEERHFGRAAARLHLSQPALSRRIAALERLVGCTLLRRSAHHVDVTPAGVVLLDHARTIVGDVERAVVATRAAQSVRAGSAAGWVAPLVAAVESGVGLDALRTVFEGLLASFPLPEGVGVRPVRLAGVPCLTVGTGRRPRVLHLHGGGYVMGSAYGYRALAGAIAVAADVDVVVPDYRLAPEHPYPASLEDVLAVYRALAADRPRDLVLSGDSAGAGLALTLLLSARSLGLPLPGRTVLLSPWIDPSPIEDEGGDVAAAGWVRAFAARYAHTVDLGATVDPLTADLTDLPPTLVQAGSSDPTVDQARSLARRLREHRCTVDLETFPVGTHVFHHLWSLVPDAAAALDGIGRFVAAGTGARRPMAG